MRLIHWEQKMHNEIIRIITIFMEENFEEIIISYHLNKCINSFIS